MATASKFPCTLCSYSSTTAGSLSQHNRIHSGEKSFKCDQCDYSTYYSGHLKTHKRIHSGEKPFKFDQCEISTSYSGVLKTHKRRQRDTFFPKPCSFCRREFRDKVTVARHTVSGHGRAGDDAVQCGEMRVNTCWCAVQCVFKLQNKSDVNVHAVR